MAWPNLSSDTIRIPSFCNAMSIGFGVIRSLHYTIFTWNVSKNVIFQSLHHKNIIIVCNYEENTPPRTICKIMWRIGFLISFTLWLKLYFFQCQRSLLKPVWAKLHMFLIGNAFFLTNWTSSSYLTCRSRNFFFFQKTCKTLLKEFCSDPLHWKEKTVDTGNHAIYIHILWVK